MEANVSTKSIIFIRRDNITDLVCTTPAIRAARLKFPKARIGIFVNAYSAEVVRNSPDIDEVYVYDKVRHSADNRLKILFKSLNVIRRIRAERFDVAIGCGSYSTTLARYTYLTGAKLRIGYVPRGKSTNFYNNPVAEPASLVHEVEAAMGLLRPLGVTGSGPALRLRPSVDQKKAIYRDLLREGLKETEKIVIIHISSSRPENRWPRENFRTLADMVQEKRGLRVLLLWSPGKAEGARPGDDAAAEWIASSMKKKPLVFRTDSLRDLIAAMSIGHSVVCCDGGAMHIAAALGKPILTIWGSTDRRRWAPWGVPNMILQSGGNAALIDPGSAFEAFGKLLPGL